MNTTHTLKKQPKSQAKANVIDITKKIEARLSSGGNVSLLPSDYVTSGGEGAIYRKASTIFKVYIDGSNHDEIEEKIGLLKPLKDIGRIICPEDVLFSAKGSVIGFTMPAIDGDPLVKYFTNDQWAKVGYDLRQAKNTVEWMQDIVRNAHYHHALIVDGNEMNYLVHQEQDQFFPSIIDVDSWQIGRFKPTAIMPSIRDHHTPGFNVLTDWFSWGVVTFQLFTGIHPYKGRHPLYKIGEMEKRMKDLVTVFDPKVQMPFSVRDFNDIPKELLAWYREIFTTTNRCPPPGQFEAVQPSRVKARVVITSSGKLSFNKLKEYNNPIIKVFPEGDVLTNGGVEGKNPNISWNIPVRKVAQTEILPYKEGLFIAGYVVGNGKEFGLVFCPPKPQLDQTINLQLRLKSFFRSGKRLFGVHDMGMTELVVMEIGGKKVCTSGNTWNFNLRSTFVGEGMMVYDALKAQHIILPVGDAGCIIARCTDLDNMKILEAKAFNNFACCLVKDRQGQNYKIEILYNNDGTVVNSWKAPTDEVELNFAMNSRGIVATIVEDGKLVLFSPANGKGTTIDHKHITTDMKLWNMSGNIVFSRGKELWSIAVT